MANLPLVSRIKRINRSALKRHFTNLWLIAMCKVSKLLGQGYPNNVDAICTHMTLAEKYALFRLSRQLPYHSVVAEIGSYHGASSCCLAAGIASVNGVLYCIDTWNNDAVTDFSEDVFPVWETNTKVFSEHIKPIRGYSQNVAPLIPDELGLLFIDGDHSYEGVKNDLELYLPKLKSGGVLIMHDCSHDAVYRAIKEFVIPVQRKKILHIDNLYSCQV